MAEDSKSNPDPNDPLSDEAKPVAEEAEASTPAPPESVEDDSLQASEGESAPADAKDDPMDQSLDDLQAALTSADGNDASAEPDATDPDIGSQSADDASADEMLDEASIDELLKQASFEDPASVSPGSALPDVDAMDLPNFSQVIRDAQVSSIDLLRDVDLNVKIELGRSRMLVEDVLKLAEGSVVELDKLAGDPVDVFVNDRLVARGEVLVLNDTFCVRINEIVAGVKDEGG